MFRRRFRGQLGLNTSLASPMLSPPSTPPSTSTFIFSRLKHFSTIYIFNGLKHSILPSTQFYVHLHIEMWKTHFISIFQEYSILYKLSSLNSIVQFHILFYLLFSHQHCQRKRSGRASLYSRDSKELQVKHLTDKNIIWTRSLISKSIPIFEYVSEVSKFLM